MSMLFLLDFKRTTVTNPPVTVFWALRGLGFPFCLRTSVCVVRKSSWIFFLYIPQDYEEDVVWKIMVLGEQSAMQIGILWGKNRCEVLFVVGPFYFVRRFKALFFHRMIGYTLVSIFERLRVLGVMTTRKIKVKVGTNKKTTLWLWNQIFFCKFGDYFFNYK